MNKYFLTILCLLFFCSCNYLTQDASIIPIARVNDSYLYNEDIIDLISKNTTKDDSTLIVNNFINRWATKQLLIDQSMINLSQEKQDFFNEMVSQYKTDLYTEAYKSSIISKQLDTVILKKEYEDYYNLHKRNFKLNDELLKVRYIQVDKNFLNLKVLEKKIKRYDSIDKKDLINLSIKFKSFNLNDSIWIKSNVLIGRLPVLKEENLKVLKKPNYTQLQDSLGVYLIKIEATLKTNDIAPLSYVRPTIEQIILNKRKQDLLKKIQKDITIDAIKNENFEIFTKN
jgi:hypothetical protein